MNYILFSEYGVSIFYEIVPGVQSGVCAMFKFQRSTEERITQRIYEHIFISLLVGLYGQFQDSKMALQSI